jgi:hypothetical protein
MVVYVFIVSRQTCMVEDLAVFGQIRGGYIFLRVNGVERAFRDTGAKMMQVAGSI